MTLPAPYFQDDAVTIYHGDCREFLPDLPKVDLVLTDPPYGVGFRRQPWDKPERNNDWLTECRDKSPIVIFTTAPLTLWDYPQPDWVLSWHRPASSARRPDGKFNHWTPLLVYGEWHGAIDIISLHAMANAMPVDYPHPCPKPIALLHWLVNGTQAQTILDPFMGSGTTLRAAKDLGRKSIGIEIEERYCEIAARRMQQACLPLATEPSQRGATSAETLALPWGDTDGKGRRG